MIAFRKRRMNRNAFLQLEYSYSTESYLTIHHFLWEKFWEQIIIDYEVRSMGELWRLESLHGRRWREDDAFM